LWPSPETTFVKALGKDMLCQVTFYAEFLALGKAAFTECNLCRELALTKKPLCQGPDFWRSAKKQAPSKELLSGHNKLESHTKQGHKCSLGSKTTGRKKFLIV
jgi:hypothetical protein